MEANQPLINRGKPGVEPEPESQCHTDRRDLRDQATEVATNRDGRDEEQDDYVSNHVQSIILFQPVRERNAQVLGTAA